MTPLRSVAQEDVERRKAVYHEVLVRRLNVQRERWLQDLGWSPAEAARHYTITTTCDMLRYADPPGPNAAAAAAAGVIAPLDKDTTIYDALARLELARRSPARAPDLFNWAAAGETRGAYWKRCGGDLEKLELLRSEADFGLNVLLRLVYLYGELPVTMPAPWHDDARFLWDGHRRVVPISEHFDLDQQKRIQAALRRFKYWHDDPFRVLAHNALHAARRDRAVEDQEKENRDRRAQGQADKEISEDDRDADGPKYKYEMQYWSENHQILFATAQYLAGQLMPDAVFRPGEKYRDPHLDYHDLTGRDHVARAKVRLNDWLGDRLRFGFSECNAPGYYDEHAIALLNLVDFALDEPIRTRAAMVLDLLVFDLARYTHRGSFSVAATRAHFKHKNCGWQQTVGDLVEMLFGTRGGWYVYTDTLAATAFASSRRYEVPNVLLAIGRHRPELLIDRTRTSIDFEEAAEHGIGFGSEADVMRWWSRAAWFVTHIVERTREFVERYGLEETDPFKGSLPKGRLLSLGMTAKSLAGYAVAGAHWPLAIPLIGNPFKDDEDAAGVLSVLTEGSALTRNNIYTYRNADAMLSSAQNHRTGQLSFQGNNCQATLSMCATVFTSHPSAGGGIDQSVPRTTGNVIGGAAGAIGGGLLGGLLGGPTAVIGAIAGARKGGKALGKAFDEDLHILPPEDDGPNWWTGTVTQPRVVQIKGAAIVAYKPKAFQTLLFGHRFHAYFPQDAFDDLPGHIRASPPQDPGVHAAISAAHFPWREPRSCNVKTGRWVFGRVGEGYLGLFSANLPEWVHDGDWPRREIVVPCKRNVFIFQIGNKVEFGSYERFIDRVLRSRIHVSGLEWGLTDFQCSYDVPNGARLELHYDEEEVRYAGAPFADDRFPRVDNTYARVNWCQNRYVIQHAGHALLHDRAAATRSEDWVGSALVHQTGLKFYSQNMGLFHHVPSYAGKEREAALRKLIDVLRREQPDVVGLSEMWHPPDIDEIRDQLGELYPYSLQGPNAETWLKGATLVGGILGGAVAGAKVGHALTAAAVAAPPLAVVTAVIGAILGGDEAKDVPLNGGLLLLSRHPISQANRTIYKKGAGEDDWSYKGVLHARVHPLGHACEYDVFLSHTQNLMPIIGEDDAHDALAHQIRHLGSFIRACRDPANPALLMGDLNVDGYDPAHQALLDLLYAEMGVPTSLVPPEDVIGGEQLWPEVRIFGDRPARPFATSESEPSHISSFNDENDDRAENDAHRFGPTSQRLDYFFTWRGLLYEPRYLDDLAEVRVIQSSPGKDMSDHYGLTCRFTTIRQALSSPSTLLESLVVSVRMVRCLNTTEGPGSDKVAFTFQCVAADGRQWTHHTRRFDDVSPGAELDVSGTRFTVPSPGAFLIITAAGLEFDRHSGNDALGNVQLTLGWRELAAFAGKRMRVALPRLTGESGEYVVELELAGV